MKTKTNKILLLVTAFLSCLILAFSGMSFSTASADAPLKAGNYFYLNGEVSTSVAFANDNVEATVSNGDVLRFKNKLAIEDLLLDFDVDENITAVKVSLIGKSAYASGVIGKDGKITTTATSVLSITFGETAVDLSFNGTTEQGVTSGSNWFVVMSDSQAIVNGTTVLSTDSAEQVYCLQKTVNEGYSVVEVEIEFTVKANQTGKFTLKEVNPVHGNVDTQQKFKLKNEGAEFEKVGASVTVLTDSGFIPTAIPYEFKVQKENIVAFAPTAYALINPPTSSNLDVSVTGTGVARYFKDQKEISFSSDSTVQIKDGETLISTYNFKVMDVKDDDVSPVYDATATEIEVFEKAFKSKLVTEGVYGEDNAVYVSLGSSQYLDLPSMEDLVSDEYASYNTLKSNATLYYKTPTTSSSSSSLKVPLNAAGDYVFYVAFGDANGNKMKEKDFFTIDADDENKIELNTAKYGGYVFTFTVIDNAPIKVEKASSQGEGYIGVKFTASKFKVVASSYNEKYVLEYSATKDATNWIEIPKASTITDKEYNKDGFTYDDIKAIAYDGSMSFTPDRIGFYKITCRVESDVSGRFDEATTDIIEVNGKPKVVKPDSKWLQNNVWSVVFLSIGTLCLIGIIVLLCIKPKDEDAEEANN